MVYQIDHLTQGDERGYLQGMETIVEAPEADTANNQRKYLITPANARELQQKAVQARLHNQIAEKIAENSKAQALKDEPRLAMVERHLAKVAKLMDDSEDASEWLKLSAARANLFREWQVLSGTPNPGSAKSKRSSKPAMIQPEPIAETPKV